MVPHLNDTNKLVRLSKWISKANKTINKPLTDKSSVVPQTEKHQSQRSGATVPKLCLKPPKVIQQSHRGARRYFKLSWKQTNSREFIIQHSILKGMTWDLCVAESSVIILLKSKHCMKTNAEQEISTAVFSFTPRSEKLYSV